MTSSLRKGSGLGREELGIIIVGSLGEGFRYSKRWVRSAFTDSRVVTRSLTKSTLSLLGGKRGILSPPLRRVPCVVRLLISLVIYGCKDLWTPKRQICPLGKGEEVNNWVIAPPRNIEDAIGKHHIMFT